MIGCLPTSLDVNGRSYEIRSDYRNVLTIFEALQDPDLKDEDKFYVILQRIYTNADGIPRQDYTEAFKQAVWFIRGSSYDDDNNKASPRLVSWVRDESLIFPAINKVAGKEVRLCQYIHWWTFLGYFATVDKDDLWSFVLTIRQKKSKGKKLEKYEQQFVRSNGSLFNLSQSVPKESAQDELEQMFKSLTGG